MKRWLLFPATAFVLAAGIPSSPDLGKAEGQCRTGEKGPAFIVSAIGLKDHSGLLKVEVYPANDDDFLEDDNVLVAAGKTFRRIEVPVPKSGLADLCIRVPSAGTYTVSVLHDRDSNRKFGWRVDGIGFPGTPKLGWKKPKVASARVVAGAGLTRVPVRLQYLRGLGFSPVKTGD